MGRSARPLIAIILPYEIVGRLVADRRETRRHGLHMGEMHAVRSSRYDDHCRTGRVAPRNVDAVQAGRGVKISPGDETAIESD
jgi:hypothetical protein